MVYSQRCALTSNMNLLSTYFFMALALRVFLHKFDSIRRTSSPYLLELPSTDAAAILLSIGSELGSKWLGNTILSSALAMDVSERLLLWSESWES